MRVALIDLSLVPLRKGSRRPASLGRRFQPSVHLMKVYAFCRRERIEVRLLSFREEMADMSRYSLVVAGGSMPEPRSSQYARIAIENLGWPDASGKTVISALYDMHEGTELCVVGDPGCLDGRLSLLGAEIDSMYADPDMYAETLYLRGKTDLTLRNCGRRVLDVSYGRVMKEDGTMFSPAVMAMGTGTEHLYIDDPDPSAIPPAIMAGFLSSAFERGLRVHFRNPLDLSAMDDAVIRAMRRTKWYGVLFVKGYSLAYRHLAMDLADICGAKGLCIYETDVGKDAVLDEGHIRAITELTRSMYEAERMGIGYKCSIADSALGSRFGPLYRAVSDWRNNARAYHPQTLRTSVLWKAEDLASKGSADRGRSDELLSLYEEACDASREFKELSENYSGTSVSLGRYVYKEEKI